MPRFRRPSDVIFFSSIFLFAAAVPLLMRLQLPRLRSLLKPSRALPSPEPARVEQITAYVNGAIQLGSPLICGSCLTRGLTQYYFLNRAGFDVALCFGMGRTQDDYAAHCWLVRDGEPFLEPRDPRPLYSTFYSFPARSELEI